MSVHRAAAAAVVFGLLGFASPGGAGAEEAPFELRPAETVKTVLEQSAGRTVTVVLASGQELTGVVAKVGEHAVHLTRLTGRDFYDAVLLIERIDGVIFRARGK